MTELKCSGRIVLTEDGEVFVENSTDGPKGGSDWKRHALNALLPAALIAGLGLAAWGASKNEDSLETAARKKCAAYWVSAVTAKGEAVRAEEGLLGNLSRNPKAGEEILREHAKKAGALDRDFVEKARKWQACMARQRRNAPVAVQPKAIPRARSAP